MLKMLTKTTVATLGVLSLGLTSSPMLSADPIPASTPPTIIETATSTAVEPSVPPSTLPSTVELQMEPVAATSFDMSSIVVTSAMKYLGIRYRWGGTNPRTGLDCSGFVQRTYQDLWISLPRTSRSMATVGSKITSLEEAIPGDLLTFGRPVHHVAIYIGDGMMIHSPHRGTVVQLSRVSRRPTAIRRVI